jgi:hypothetical protein
MWYNVAVIFLVVVAMGESKKNEIDLCGIM